MAADKAAIQQCLHLVKLLVCLILQPIWLYHADFPLVAHYIHDIFIKGAEAAIRENENQQAIADFKKRTGYVQAVDEQLDSLSAEEKAEYEAQDAQ